MKRRATAILLGIMVSSMFLSACGKNEAKEAANESAQPEPGLAGCHADNGQFPVPRREQERSPL